MKFLKIFLVILFVLIAGWFLLTGGWSTMQSSYKKALKVNTIEGYEKFVLKYPDSEYRSEIEEKISELKLFYDAKAENTITAYQEFIDKYPNTEHYEEIESRIAFLIGFPEVMNLMITKHYTDPELIEYYQ